MSGLTWSRTTAVAALIAMPTVVAALGLVSMKVWRIVQPRSAMFAAPTVVTLAEAIERRDAEQAYAFIRDGQDPNAPIAVRHAILTGGRTVAAPPLLWAVAMQDEAAVKMLLGFGARPGPSTARAAACTAEWMALPDIAHMVRTHAAVPPPGPCQELSAAVTVLRPVLAPGGSIRSPNGRFRLIYQRDGNLVLYDDETRAPRWATGTERTEPGHAVLHDTGEFVVYDAHGQPRWSTPTTGHVNAVLMLEDDGNVVLRDSRGSLAWECCPRTSSPVRRNE